jgi:hypothetical protein
VIPPVEEALEKVRAFRKVGPETERADEEAVARVVCPVTVRVEAVVVANVEVPKTVRVPPTEVFPAVVRDVTERLGERAIVEVLERTILAPAVKNDEGEVKKLFQLVEDAMSGIAYPA